MFQVDEKTSEKEDNKENLVEKKVISEQREIKYEVNRESVIDKTNTDLDNVIEEKKKRFVGIKRGRRRGRGRWRGASSLERPPYTETSSSLPIMNTFPTDNERVQEDSEVDSDDASVPLAVQKKRAAKQRYILDSHEYQNRFEEVFTEFVYCVLKTKRSIPFFIYFFPSEN